MGDDHLFIPVIYLYVFILLNKWPKMFFFSSECCCLHVTFLTLSGWGLVQALARQAKLEYAEEMKKEIEVCQKIAADRAQNKYKKHFEICKNIMGQIVDLATKMEEYRQLTGKYVIVCCLSWSNRSLTKT